MITGCCVVVSAPRAYSAPILEGVESSSDSGVWTVSDTDRNAKAIFSIENGNTLKIELKNLADLTDQNDEFLTGLFFGFGGTLENPSVVLNSGSSVYTYDKKKGTTVESDPNPITLNGEFGYLTDINDINGGRGDYGISSSGLNPDTPDPYGWVGFGSAIDSSQNLTGNEVPNGPDFGISGQNGWEGNKSLDYINNSVLIRWDGATDLDVADIHQVHFIYNTSYDNVPIPEPATMFLFGTGLAGLATIRRKNKK